MVVGTVIMVVVASQCYGGFMWWWLGFFTWCCGWVCLVPWLGLLGGPASSLSYLLFKPIFFKPKTHAHEHYHQSHPWSDPLSSVYVWIDGSDSDYFWVIWWICCFVLGCVFFFFFFWEKSWLGCWWLNNGFWCGGACCWWWCGWEREREKEAVRKGDRN